MVVLRGPGGEVKHFKGVDMLNYCSPSWWKRGFVLPRAPAYHKLVHAQWHLLLTNLCSLRSRTKASQLRQHWSRSTSRSSSRPEARLYLAGILSSTVVGMLNANASERLL